MKTYFLFIWFTFQVFMLLGQQKELEKQFFLGNYQKVIEIANGADKKAKVDFNTWYYKALAENALFKYSQAVISLEQALLLKPHDINLKLFLARAYNDQGNLKKSMKLYQQILDQDSINVSAKSNLAILYKGEKEYLKAADLYSDLIKQDSTNGFFYAQLAYCCNKMGLNTPVIPYYEKAIELNPHDYKSVKALVNEIIYQKYYDVATHYIDSFLQTFTNDVYLLKQKAYVSAISGRYLDAVTEFKYVTEIGDSSLFTCKYYGQSLYNNAQYDLAVIWLEKYLDKKPDDFQNQFIMGLACQQDYQYQKSLQHLNRAFLLKHDPKMVARIYREQAQTQIMYGDFRSFRDSLQTKAIKLYIDAKDNYLKALEIYPEGWEVYKSLGVLYENKIKELKIALYYYEKYYQALNPNDINEYQLDWIQRKISSLKEKAHFLVD